MQVVADPVTDIGTLNRRISPRSRASPSRTRQLPSSSASASKPVAKPKRHVSFNELVHERIFSVAPVSPASSSKRKQAHWHEEAAEQSYFSSDGDTNTNASQRVEQAPSTTSAVPAYTLQQGGGSAILHSRILLPPPPSPPDSPPGRLRSDHPLQSAALKSPESASHRCDNIDGSHNLSDIQRGGSVASKARSGGDQVFDAILTSISDGGSQAVLQAHDVNGEAVTAKELRLSHERAADNLRERLLCISQRLKDLSVLECCHPAGTTCVLEDVLNGTRDSRLPQKLRDSYSIFTSGRANGTGSFALHTESRVVLRGSRSRAPAIIPQSLQKTRSLLIVSIAQARARVRSLVRLHLHAWHAAAVVGDLKVVAHTAFNRRLVRIRLLFQCVRQWRSLASKSTSINATALRSCLWHWRFIVPLSQRVSSQVQSMTWFHNSQLRDWVHGCVTAAITQVSPGPSLVLPPSTIAPAPPSKILAAAAAISAVESQSRHTTRVVVDKAKVTIEVGDDELLLRHVQPHIQGPSISATSTSPAPPSSTSSAARSKSPYSQSRSPSTPARSISAHRSTGSSSGVKQRSASAVEQRPSKGPERKGRWEGMEQRVHRTLAESLRDFDADVDHNAFSRLYTRVTRSPFDSAPSTSLKRQDEPNSSPVVSSAATCSSRTFPTESPLRPEHLALPKEVDSLLSSAQCGHNEQQLQENTPVELKEVQHHHKLPLSPSSSEAPTVQLAVDSPASSSVLSSSLSAHVSEQTVLSLSRPVDEICTQSPSGTTSSKDGSIVLVSDIQVDCVSPAARKAKVARPASSSLHGVSSDDRSSTPSLGGGHQRSAARSYAELSFKTVARPHRDSVNASRQQVLRKLKSDLLRFDSAPADEDVDKFIFDGHLPRHRQSTVSSTSKSAAAMLTARMAQLKVEGWKQRLHRAETERASESSGATHHMSSTSQAPSVTDSSPGTVDRKKSVAAAADSAANDGGNVDVTDVPEVAGEVNISVTKLLHVKESAAIAADAAADALAHATDATCLPRAPPLLDEAAAAKAFSSPQHSTSMSSSSLSTSSVADADIAPVASSKLLSSSAVPLRQSPIIKLGVGGARTFGGALPSNPLVRIRPPTSSSASLLASTASSSSAAVSPQDFIPFGSSLRQHPTFKSQVSFPPAADPVHSRRPPVKSSAAVSAALTAADRIAAPTISSDLRKAKSPAPSENDSGASSSSARPVILAFRDAIGFQKSSGGGGE